MLFISIDIYIAIDKLISRICVLCIKLEKTSIMFHNLYI